MTRIPWTCSACHLPIEDGKGYVWISPRLALRRMQEIQGWRPGHEAPAPEVLAWQPLHETCEVDAEGPEYWWDIERLRTAPGVAEFRAHLTAKVWALTATDLEAFTDRALARIPAPTTSELEQAS